MSEMQDPALEDPALYSVMCAPVFPESQLEEEGGLHTFFVGFDETDDQQQPAGSSTQLVPHLRAAEQAGPTDVGGLCLGWS